MKKKLLMILLLVFAACACAFGFAGCDLFGISEGSEGDGVIDADGTVTEDNGNCEHNLVKVDAKASTCNAVGNTTYWHCDLCDGYYSDAAATKKTTRAATVIPTRAHKEVVDDEGYPATCTTDGKTAKKHCTLCNKITLVQTVIPKTGHKEVTDAAVEATCKAPGKTEGKHCSVCGAVTVAQKTVAVHHTEVYDAPVAATCTTDGLSGGMHCSVCGEIIVEQYTVKGGHKIVTDDAVAVTCTTDGKTAGSHCSVCSEVLVAQITIPASHNKVTEPAVAATCTTDGMTGYTYCSRCNLTFSDNKILPKTGHKGSKICTTCNELLVTSSSGLTFTELTAMPYWYSSSSRSARSVEVIGYEVTGIGSFSGTDLVIPATYNDMPVLGIGDGAFFNYDNPNTSIQTVTIPYGVKYIGPTAFGYLPNLREVTVGDSVEVIADAAFRATAITSFKCPKSLKYLNGKVFVGCMQLKTFIFNAGINKGEYGDVCNVTLDDTASLTDIYFEGTRAQWDAISSRGDGFHEDAGWYGNIHYDSYDVTISFYSETAPTTAGNYWRYVNGNPVKW